MRKGFEWAVNIMIALILFIVAVGVFWAAIRGETPPVDSEPVEPSKTCLSDDDCIGKADGNKCLVIYPGDFTAFCGCITNDDCEVGFCGEDNKCE